MKFGYSYPELQPWNFPEGARSRDYKLSVNMDVIRLYASTRNQFLRHPNAGRGQVKLPADDENKKITGHYDYVVNVRYGKYVTSPSLTSPCAMIRESWPFP